MRIAIPLTNGQLSMHFGHCQEFALADADATSRQITGWQVVPAPEHEPGLFPAWLRQQGTEVILAGGMGSRAQSLFAQYGIKVIAGVATADPHRAVEEYLNGTLAAGENSCDH